MTGKRQHPVSRILLVEDERALVASITDLLAGEGYDVISAGSLAAARRCLKRHDVQLVMLDLTLPDGSGLDLLDQLPKPPQGPVTVLPRRLPAAESESWWSTAVPPCGTASSICSSVAATRWSW